MAHWSEDSKKLQVTTAQIDALSKLRTVNQNVPGVFMFWLPFPRNGNASEHRKNLRNLISFCGNLNESSVVCIMTTPGDAAILLPLLSTSLKFQLWVAVKVTPNAYPNPPGTLTSQHAALLIMTRYKGALRHTKTRLQYTYCPSCRKTTKDYGGKKHTYHSYGTLISDIWRDFECAPRDDISPIIDRLCDLFGLEEYRQVYLLDMRECTELLPPPCKEVSVFTEMSKGNQIDSQLFNGDCIETLQSLPDNSIDFCFADPPYNLRKKYDSWDDALESREYFNWCDKWLSELCRVLKPGRTLSVLNIPLWAARHFQHLNSTMEFQNWIVWEGLSFPVRMIMPAHYAIISFSKGKPRLLPGLRSDGHSVIEEDSLKPLIECYCLRASCIQRRGLDRGDITDLWHDIHRLKHNSRRVDHPCQLPPMLMRRLLALFTEPREIILDCFNGSGTSTLVAQQMNRKFIGIELSSRYHEITIQRHNELSRGVDPFRKADTIPVAKNSPVRRVPKQKYLVSKKALQLDVKRIAYELGRLPSREEVQKLSKFPIDYFEKYFVSWGEVCAAARTTGMSENPPEPAKPFSHEQLSLRLRSG